MGSVEQRLKSALLALRAAQDMLREIRRTTTDTGQAEAIDNLCAKIAEVIQSDELGAPPGRAHD